MNEQEIEDLNGLATFAVRYALGRATYVSHMVPCIIMRNKDYIYPRTWRIFIHDIDSFKKTFGQIGWEMDEKNWMEFKEDCQRELEKKEEKGMR